MAALNLKSRFHSGPDAPGSPDRGVPNRLDARNLIRRNRIGQQLAMGIALFLLTAFLSGCPHYSSGLPPSLRLDHLEPDQPARGILHKVLPDQNLLSIAKAYNIDLQALAEVNNLRPPYMIKADSSLFIPGASQVMPVESAKTEPQEKEKTEVRDFTGLLSWPVEGKIISEFGVRGGTQYNGITIQAPEGSPVRASGNGRVGHVGTITLFGNVVLIEHPNNLVTVYAHLKEIKVTAGDTVKNGQIIGTVGSSGRSEGPTLYYEVRSRKKPRNPLFFMDRKAEVKETG
ncbi:membrane-bound metallopeptidase [Desulfomonile tiedjei DSM 6799]|uniref:Membrane-bound metallopeptidase n=1 Tax=Desulfomonile tiedjei (strain ATCC 49306 / DSM 6799 / DCB-1) TaxID=706587 RepID=I4C4G5_DESTA|nr:membrane-bound metallopeptidase [Desulfomonile tiedjei DSM 6799]